MDEENDELQEDKKVIEQQKIRADMEALRKEIQFHADALSTKLMKLDQKIKELRELNGMH